MSGRNCFFINYSNVCLHVVQYAMARDMYLHACSHTPSSLTWLGVGVACYRLGEHEEAEEALCEANILNNHDPEVWAYLAMVCLQVSGAQHYIESQP